MNTEKPALNMSQDELTAYASGRAITPLQQILAPPPMFQPTPGKGWEQIGQTSEVAVFRGQASGELLVYWRPAGSPTYHQIFTGSPAILADHIARLVTAQEMARGAQEAE